MALHTELPIYRKAYELLSVAVEITRNIPRDFKRLLGDKIRDECLEITVLIFRANVCRDKVPHITDLIEKLQIVELTLRLSCDMRLISKGQYAKAIRLTQDVGRQASRSHRDRARLGRLLLRRGQCMNGALTKTYRR